MNMNFEHWNGRKSMSSQLVSSLGVVWEFFFFTFTQTHTVPKVFVVQCMGALVREIATSWVKNNSKNFNTVCLCAMWSLNYSQRSTSAMSALVRIISQEYKMLFPEKQQCAMWSLNYSRRSSSAMSALVRESWCKKVLLPSFYSLLTLFQQTQSNTLPRQTSDLRKLEKFGSLEPSSC